MAEAAKWGVMGNATIARKCVIPAICKSGNGKLVALATRSPAQAEQVVADNRIEHVYDSYEALLVDPQIDLVYIPLPNHLHHPWTIKALKAGKHVLCEKPLACNAREAMEMAAAAEDAGRLLMEAFMYRFHPRSRRIKQLIAEGAIGAPRLVRSAFCFRMADSEWSDPPNVRLNPEMGGGALYDVGCYALNAQRMIAGREPLTAWCTLQWSEQYGVDVAGTATLDFGGGLWGSVYWGYDAAYGAPLVAVGTKARLTAPHGWRPPPGVCSMPYRLCATSGLP